MGKGKESTGDKEKTCVEVGEKKEVEELEKCGCPAEALKPKKKQEKNAEKRKEKETKKNQKEKRKSEENKQDAKRKKIVELEEKKLGDRERGTSMFAATFQYKDMKRARAAEKAAIRQSGKTFWNIPEVSIIGRSLYTRLKFNELKQKYRDQKKAGKAEEDSEDVMKYREIRERILNQCNMLIERCGGMAELENRSDDCFHFVEEAKSIFHISSDELE